MPSGTPFSLQPYKSHQRRGSETMEFPTGFATGGGKWSTLENWPEPKKWWFPIGIPIFQLFSGAMLDFWGRLYHQGFCSHPFWVQWETWPKVHPGSSRFVGPDTFMNHKECRWSTKITEFPPKRPKPFKSYCWWFRNPQRSPPGMMLNPVVNNGENLPTSVSLPDFWKGPLSTQLHPGKIT